MHDHLALLEIAADKLLLRIISDIEFVALTCRFLRTCVGPYIDVSRAKKIGTIPGVELWIT